MNSPSGDPVENTPQAATFHWAILIWPFAALSLALSWAAGQAVPVSAWVVPALLALALAAVVSVASARRRDGLAARLAVALGFVSMASLLLAGLWQTAWAAGGDIAYAAVLALLLAYRDARVLAVAAAALLVQRAALALLLPSLSTLAASGPLSTPAASGPLSTLAASALLLIEAAALIRATQMLGRSAMALQQAIAAAREAAVKQERSLRLMSETASDLAGQATAYRLAQQFEQDIGRLVAAATHAAVGVRGAVQKISDVAAQSAGQAAAITGASGETSASARNVAVSVEQLAASVARVTREVREVSEASYKAMDDAGATNETVQRLADTAGQIGNIVRTIRGIADRTNLLALNASIEAARAGEAGKGFSVVAGEVKALARQTARATEDIQAQIGSIGEDMARAIAAIDGIAATVAHLGGITVSVAGSMEEQATVAQDLASSASRAAASTETVVSNLHSLTEGATRADTAAREGRRDAEQLAQQCDNVEAAVRDFVKSLLAA